MKSFQCSLRNFDVGFISPSRLVFDVGGAEHAAAAQEKEVAARLQKEVSRDLEAHKTKIDEAEGDPKKIEAVLEQALQEIAQRYAGKIEEGAAAQKQALDALVQRACDTNDDGKINLPNEIKLYRELSKDIKELSTHIDDAAKAAQTKIRETGEMAARLKIEVGKDAPADIRKAYEKYDEAGKDYFSRLKEYDIEGNLLPGPVKTNAVLDKLIRAADRGNMNYKRLQAGGQLKKEAERIANELNGVLRTQASLKQELAAAIDRWSDEAVAKARREYGASSVEARSVAEKINRRKTELLADQEKGEKVEGAREQAAAETGKEKDKLTKMEQARTETKETALRFREVANLEKTGLENLKREHGLGKDEEITERNILVALTKKAVAENDQDYLELLGRNKLVAVAKGILAQLKAQEGRYETSLARADQKEQAAADLEKKVSEQQARVQGTELVGRTNIATAKGVDTVGNAKRRLKEKGRAATDKNKEEADKAYADVRAHEKKAYDEATKKAPETAAARMDVTTHEVVRGDTMYEIAKKYYGPEVNVKFALALQAASLGSVELLKGGKNSLIKPGQIINLPKNFSFGGKNWERKV